MHALQYSPFHADLLASGGDDASVVLRDGAQSPVCVTKEVGSSGDAHSDYVRALEWLQAPAPSNSGDSDSPRLSTAVLATGSWDQTVRTWVLEEESYASA